MEKRIPFSTEEQAEVMTAVVLLANDVMAMKQELEEYIKANPGKEEDAELLAQFTARWNLLAGIVEKVKQ